MSSISSWVAGFQPQPPGFDPESGYMGIEMDGVVLGQVSPSSSVFRANSHFINRSISISHPVIDAI
jgi:hypothetical protein